MRDAPVVIIGAGASGLMAAVEAAQAGTRHVLLLEKEPRVGRKLLATGNGRCNLMNMRPQQARFHGSGVPVALSLLAQTPPDALLARFAALGLRCREEAEGRVYPFSGQASAVLDVLREACDRLAVQVRTGAAVEHIQPYPGGLRVTLAGGETLDASRVIVAGGGKATPSHGSDGSALGLLAACGHTLAPVFPAIVPLKLPAWRVRGLKGIRIQGRVLLYAEGHLLHSEQGEALFTDYGLSGIAAMQLARAVHEAMGARQEPVLSIALLDEAEAAREVDARLARIRGLPMEGFFIGLLHRRLGECFLREAGISPQTPASPAHRDALIALLSGWRLPVQGTMPFAQAQVMAGGAILSEFDPDTLASCLVPGLYACGEVLDVDGDCGGYNLMWAWLSGMAAGKAVAQ